MGKFYRIGEFAGRIGRSPGTVRRWEREGLLAAHQNWLARFGFGSLHHVAQRNDCRITVVNAETQSRQEFVEDLVAIVPTFRAGCAGWAATGSS